MASDLIARLAAVDERLDREGVVRRTLDLGRVEASALATVGVSLAPALARDAQEALVDGLIALVDAVREHFPENLFWDLDGLAARLVRETRGDAREMRDAFTDVVALHALFGRDTAIRFRYVHDFVYGFDWARWVRRDPSARARTHPYDRAFLGTLLRRGHELLRQIEANDARYPPLGDDASHRNPFGFSREPEAELRLYRDLAARRLVPVEAWSIDARAVWDRPYGTAREERARALGLAR